MFGMIKIMAEITTGLMVSFGARQGAARSDVRCTLLMHDTGHPTHPFSQSLSAGICTSSYAVDLLSAEFVPASARSRQEYILSRIAAGASSRTIACQEQTGRASTVGKVDLIVFRS